MKKQLVNENLRDELIDKVMNTIYRDDDPKYDKWNAEYLNSLSLHKLHQMLDDHYVENKRR